MKEVRSSKKGKSREVVSPYPSCYEGLRFECWLLVLSSQLLLLWELKWWGQSSRLTSPAGFYPFHTRDSLHYINTGTERKSSTWANTMTGRKDVFALRTWCAILHFVPIVSIPPGWIPYFARLSKENILKGLNLSNEAYSTTGISSGSLLRLLDWTETGLCWCPKASSILCAPSCLRSFAWASYLK